jgi:hypothetical protein
MQYSENGHLKLKQPVELAEGTPARVTVTPRNAKYVWKDPLAGVVGIGDSGRTHGAGIPGGDESQAAKRAAANPQPQAGRMFSRWHGANNGAVRTYQ